MYQRIQPVSELPEDAKICGDSAFTHFFTVQLFGLTYYIPIRKGCKTAIEKLGIKKIEDMVRDIIHSVKMQVRDDVASDIHQNLRQQISDGFEKMYSQNLFAAITGKMDEKLALTEHKEKVYSEEDMETIIKAFHLDVNGGVYNAAKLEWCKNWIKENVNK